MTKPAPINVQVSRRIDADADTVYELISDITRMPEWSPETIETKWVGKNNEAVVGAKFQGTNQLGKSKWKTKPTITAAEPGRVFEFRVPRPSGAVWRYDIESDGEQTVVTESVSQVKPSPAPIRYLQRRSGVTDRAANLRENMTQTLDRLAATAAAS